MRPELRAVGEEDRHWIDSLQERLFAGDIVVSRGRVHRPRELSGFVAVANGERVGLATFDVRDAQCELVTLDALRPWRGIGTALLGAVEQSARAAGCTRLWLITTNDNVAALRFYQRRGFALVAVHRNAIAESRKLKPAIPMVGHFAIPITDEIELDKAL